MSFIKEVAAVVVAVTDPLASNTHTGRGADGSVPVFVARRRATGLILRVHTVHYAIATLLHFYTFT